MLRLVLLATSLAAAFGNYGFLVGLNDTLPYMVALSLSSFFVGAFSYAALPNLVARLSPGTLIALLAVVAIAGCVAASGSRTAVLVFLTIFLFLTTEITLASQGEWVGICVLRIAMMVTGGLSWLAADAEAIALRAAGVAVLAVVLMLLWLRKPQKPKSEPLPSVLLLSLVAVNLIWVYLLPLMLVLDTAQSQRTFLYIATTLTPLIYFKAQDAVFKLDILFAKGAQGSPLLFLFAFAGPLALFYLALPVLQYLDYIQASWIKVLIFSLVSLLFLLANIVLTNRLRQARDPLARVGAG